MEKTDTTSEKNETGSVASPPQATSNNPLYCSYVDGRFTYKDPNTSVQYVWNEGEKKWVVKEQLIDSNKLEENQQGGDNNDNDDDPNNDQDKQRGSGSGGEQVMTPGTSQVQFDGENYTYTDQDGTVFLWDSGKGAWFPKDQPTSSSSSLNQCSFQLPPSPPDLSSSSSSTTQTVGFFNPNYSTSLTSPTTTNNTATTTTTSSSSLDTTISTSGGGSSRRFYYASLSPTTMGVNENPGLFLSPDDQVNNNDQVPGGENTSNNDPPAAEDTTSSTSTSGTESTELPPGWEKHEDTNGPYYWHVKSGTIQRERPTVHSPVTSSLNVMSQMSSTNTTNPALMIPGGITGFVRRSNTVVGGLGNSGNERVSSSSSSASMNEKRRSWVNYLEDDRSREQQHPHHPHPHQHHQVIMPAYEVDKNALKFAAVSLGCLSISEEDLTPERSSRAVSKVIAELTSTSSSGNKEPGIRSGLENPSRIWTHTDATATLSSSHQMYLELTDSHLRVRVTAPTTATQQQQQPVTVLEQPIHSIRVWGVGREDPRDFAFVAREKMTRQFMCHVFRLDMYAKPLASSLRDACKKIMIERQQRVSERGSNKRPTSLGLKKLEMVNNNNSNNKGGSSSVPGGNNITGLFPTPMDEPRKMIKAFYLGSKSVNKPTGMDVLNSAIDSLRSQGVERIPVLVSVAPSVIGVTSTESPPKVQLEVRVRFLSFMGIGTDIRTCGIIIHTARDDFEAHCFYSTPSTGALCKAIEAACVLRYQKCLDAHHGGPAPPPQSNYNNNNNHNFENGGGGGRARSNPESNSSTAVTSPKTAAVLASATASNLASALKTVFSSFGKAKSVEEK